MRDAAFAIHNGFVSVFGDDTESLMCYVHVIRAIDRRPMVRKVNRVEIKRDISNLRLAYDVNCFQIGCQLFSAKWLNNEPDFVQYFRDTWVAHNSKWFNGACYRMVKTNNALENWNFNLKKYHTHWKVTGLNQFKVDLMTILKKESAEYIQDKQPFKNDITISNNMCKEGWNLRNTKSIILRKGSDGKGRCYIRRGANEDVLTGADVDAFLVAEYASFDEYVQHMFDLYIVTFDTDVKRWKETSTCTCPSFADNFICKHVMCMVYLLGLEKYKTEHYLQPNRAPGRPKKATPALQID